MPCLGVCVILERFESPTIAIFDFSVGNVHSDFEYLCVLGYILVDLWFLGEMCRAVLPGLGSMDGDVLSGVVGCVRFCDVRGVAEYVSRVFGGEGNGGDGRTVEV